MGTVNRFADAWRLREGTLAVIRPATPGDAPAIQAMVRSLSPTSRYSRFFSGVQEVSPEWLARFSRAEPRGEVSLLATVLRDGKETLVGMGQYAADPWPERCDFALLVSDEWQGRGLGRRLLRNLECLAREAGFERIEGEVLAHNSTMLGLAHVLGYDVRRVPESALFLHVSLPLLRVAEQGCSPLVKVAHALAETV
ncbi:MAG TPA: GNAT family N-acetyltransferase [Burkholderiales bacterium]|nr:GNAT family N-acetyltransferase [Burkholderiales bacterium]